MSGGSSQRQARCRRTRPATSSGASCSAARNVERTQGHQVGERRRCRRRPGCRSSSCRTPAAPRQRPKSPSATSDGDAGRRASPRAWRQPAQAGRRRVPCRADRRLWRSFGSRAGPGGRRHGEPRPRCRRRRSRWPMRRSVPRVPGDDARDTGGDEPAGRRVVAAGRQQQHAVRAHGEALGLGPTRPGSSAAPVGTGSRTARRRSPDRAGERIAEQAGARLRDREGDGVAAVGRQAPSRTVGDVAERLVALLDSGAGAVRHAGAAVDRGHGRPRDARAGRHVLQRAPGSRTARSTGHAPDRPFAAMTSRNHRARWGQAGWRSRRARCRSVALALGPLEVVEQRPHEEPACRSTPAAMASWHARMWASVTRRSGRARGRRRPARLPVPPLSWTYSGGSCSRWPHQRVGQAVGFDRPAVGRRRVRQGGEADVHRDWPRRRRCVEAAGSWRTW